MRKQHNVSFLISTGMNVALTMLSAYVSLVATDGDVFSTVLISLLVFSVGLCVTIQIELRNYANRLSDQIESRATEMSSFGQLFSQIAEGARFNNEYREIVAAVNTATTNFSGTVIEQECARLIQDLHREVQALAQGILIVDSFDPALKVALLNTPELKLYTTSLVKTDLQFYRHPDGQNYWNEQKRALARRVNGGDVLIERIFIWDAWGDELASVINEHRTAGVRVLIVEEARLPVRDRVDVTYWGNEYTFRQHYAERPPGSGKWFDRFSINHSDVRDAQQLYARVRALAIPVIEAVGPGVPPEATDPRP